MNIVAIANQKGGVGKTTLTLAIASEVARRGGRALIVDADPQANATDTIAGDDFDADDAPTLYDVFVSGEDGAAAGAIRSMTWPGVDLVPGDIQVARYDEHSGIGSEQRLRTALTGIDGYDITLIDCPRALGALTSAALTAAHQVLVVAEPTKDSLKGVGMLMETTASRAQALQRQSHRRRRGPQPIRTHQGPIDTSRPAQRSARGSSLGTPTPRVERHSQDQRGRRPTPGHRARYRSIGASRPNHQRLHRSTARSDPDAGGLMPTNDMLRNPLGKAKPLAKAPRAEHPGEPATPLLPVEVVESRPGTSVNRLGPNRVRKSFYLPTDVADDLTRAANRIHHESTGRISKAEAAGALIRLGLNNLPSVYEYLQMPHVPTV